MSLHEAFNLYIDTRARFRVGKVSPEALQLAAMSLGALVAQDIDIITRDLLAGWEGLSGDVQRHMYGCQASPHERVVPHKLADCPSEHREEAMRRAKERDEYRQKEKRAAKVTRKRGGKIDGNGFGRQF